MRRRYLSFVLSALGVLMQVPGFATHIVGGEMTYTCLGNNQYLIELTIFRDCYNGIPWFDDPASIAAYRQNDPNFVPFAEELVFWEPSLNDTLNPDLGSDCFVAPPDVCVHTTTYTTTMTLPPTPGGYTIVYQRCCRNNTIANLIAPEDVGATYSIEINDFALAQCNNSPVFNNWPPLYLCVNYPFSIDQSAIDPDGDSLVYRLCDPFNGASTGAPMPQPPSAPPYDPVPWIDPPYNVNNQIGGVPAMSIDPVTGLLTGTPNTIGQFVIGICVEEYRNGQLIGIKRRDYQVNIGICDFAVASFFAPEILCKSKTVTIDNQSLGADTYLWFFNDPNNPGASSSLAEPVYTYSDTGLFQIVLIAEPGTACSDTFTSEVQILPNSLFANFNLQNVDCADSLTIQVTDSSLDTLSAVAQWSWNLTYNGNQTVSTEQNPQFVLTEPGQAELVLIVQADNGCSDTLSNTFPIIFINDPLIEDSLAICKGDAAVPLNPGGAFPGATYNWTPAAFLDNPTSPTPLANPDTTTTFSVTIDDATGFCQIEKTVTIIVSPEVEVTPVLDTILVGESVPIFATDNPTYTYDWSPADWLDANGIPNPVSTPEASVTYVLTVTDTNGCVAERTVVLVVLALCEEPYLFVPTGFTPNNDGKNDFFKVIGNNLEEVYLAVYNRWGELIFETNDPNAGWDGTFEGKILPPDAYGFYARVKCVGGLEYFKKGNVTLIR